jgi:hypothetical protein
MNDEPALAAAFREGPQARWTQAFGEVLDRAVARGEVVMDAARSLAVEAGPAIFVLRWMVSGGTIDDEVAAAVVDDLMMPRLG